MTPEQTLAVSFITSGFDPLYLISETDIFTALTQFDDDYFNKDGQSPISDSQYDTLVLFAKQSYPHNKYFTGVGSDVRGGKIDLPYELGSLDQVEIGEIENWIKKYTLQDEEIVITDKMDGTSTLIIYDEDGLPQIAYSRGNGLQGADISRHIFKIKDVPKYVSGSMVVRAEVELSEASFNTLREAGINSRSGAPYKNARNMVAGLMNSKNNPDIVYDYLSVIAYEYVNSNDSKSTTLLDLAREKFNVVHWDVVFGNAIGDDMLSTYLNDRRDDIDFAIDGVVLDANDADKRSEMNPTRDTLNPAYSVKYKVADATNLAEATVIDVEWNISKHGYLKPRVKIEPVELVGVTVQHATGFNAKFIMDNQIGPGATISITRSGDVIPFITSVLTPAANGGAFPDMDDVEWNETGVDLILTNFHDSDEVNIQQTIDFFTSTEVPHLKEGTIRSLFNKHEYADATTAILEILGYPLQLWIKYVGENGNKIHNGLYNKFNNIPLHILMGSLPYFGRGVGKRKFKKLESVIGTEALHNLSESDRDSMLSVDGFSDKTIDKILNGMDEYYNFFSFMPKYVSVSTMQDKSGGSLTDKNICMTGFRDKDLTAKIEELGGTNQSGVSSKTDILVIKDPNSTSGKAKKARDLGVTIMGIDEFKQFISE